MPDFIREFFTATPRGPYERGKGHIRWPRVVLISALAATAGLAIGNAALWLYLVRIRGLSNIRYAHSLTPAGWRQVNRAIGDRAILDAETAMSANDLPAAIRLYRVGIAKSPANARGRLALSKIYLACRRHDLARDLLVAGLPLLADDTEYIRNTLGFLLEFQFDAELRTAAAKLLTHPSRSSRRLAALHLASVALHRGNFDEVESRLSAHDLTSDPEGALLLARADLERGFPDLALARLAPALSDSSTRAPALSIAADIHTHLGHAPELARTVTLRVLDDPLSHTPRLAALRRLHTLHRFADLTREIDSFSTLFSRDEAALLALGDFAADTGQPELARRVQQLFAQNGWDAGAPSLLYAEACLAAGRHADGLLELDRCARTLDIATRYGPAHDGLRTVALFGLHRDDEARLQLDHLLAQPNLRAENLTAVASRLLAFDRPQAARLVLARATELDPRNQSALTALVRLEAESGQFETLPAHLRRLLAMRRPSRAVLELVYHRLGSDVNLLHPEQPALLAEIRQHLARPAALASVAQP